MTIFNRQSVLNICLCGSFTEARNSTAKENCFLEGRNFGAAPGGRMKETHTQMQLSTNYNDNSSINMITDDNNSIFSSYYFEI